MSAIVISAPKRDSSWLSRLVDGWNNGRNRKRLAAELEGFTEERLRDIGVSRSDISTRFRSEMRKVERLGLGDYGRC